MKSNFTFPPEGVAIPVADDTVTGRSEGSQEEEEYY
jgi:hypothetical protein